MMKLGAIRRVIYIPQARASAGAPSSLRGGFVNTLRRSLHGVPVLQTTSSREEILKYFENVWGKTEQLYDGLKDEKSYYSIPQHKLRHPFVFYTAHVAALYVNKFVQAGLIEGPLTPNHEFEKLFEAGVDEMTWDDLHDHQVNVWPDLERVKEYRQQTYDMVKEVIRTHPCLDEGVPRTMDNPSWAIFLGIEHESIHMETSSVLMRELPLVEVKTPKDWPAPLGEVQPASAPPCIPNNPWIEVEATTVSMGKPERWTTFGWDNEYGEEVHDVKPFSATSQLISNGEFNEFLQAGGYTEERYWSTAGWGWKQFRKVSHPTFWVPVPKGEDNANDKGHQEYRLRTIFEEIPMQWEYPAIVNWHEAKAYAVWKTEKDGSEQPYRLLTEKEHNAIRAGPQTRGMKLMREDPVALDSITARSMANMNLAYGSESSVTAFEPNEKGFRDVFGNVWQWCECHFHPYEGFKINDYYHDFSTPCFDAQHYMILGGSFISCGDLASIWARYHFRPHFHQHAGFRLARSEGDSDAVVLQV